MLYSSLTLLFLINSSYLINMTPTLKIFRVFQNISAPYLMATRYPLIVVGLGNPGHAAEGISIVRHNVGAAFVNHIRTERNLNPWKKLDSCFSKICEGPGYILVKPLTFMNESGKSVKRIMAHYSCPLSRLLVVHDDLDQSVGTFNLKKGSAQGHNGVRSIVGALQSNEFLRLKFGIGRPYDRDDVSDYVLSSMFVEDAMLLQTTVFEQALQKVVMLIEENSIAYADMMMSKPPNATFSKIRAKNKSFQNYWGKVLRHIKK